MTENAPGAPAGPPAAAANPTKPAPNWRDLKARLVAGVALAAVAYFLLAAGQRPFAVLVLAVSLAMSWEWGRMVRGSSLDMAFAVQAIATTIAIGLSVFGMPARGLSVRQFWTRTTRELTPDKILFSLTLLVCLALLRRLQHSLPIA